MYFPVADIELSAWIPPLVSCIISFFTSMAGVSGAFLLLPFQVSVLGFTSPAVSSTNHLFNIVAIPSGIYRFIKEKRMLWPLTWILALGTLPGVLVGVYIRIVFLPSPKLFKIFVGCVLLFIGTKLALTLVKKNSPSVQNSGKKEDKAFQISKVSLSVYSLQFDFNDTTYHINTLSISCFSMIIGIIGGIYGIGGGAIVAPFLVAVYKLPIHTVAGASLMCTFLTSSTGVLFFQLLSKLSLHHNQLIVPDYRLGLLFGAGGAIGMYFGARAQRYVNPVHIKTILCFILFFTALKYIIFP